MAEKYGIPNALPMKEKRIPQLDSNDVVPLYRQIMDEIRRDIRSGRLRPKDRLPSETELAKYYGVSIVTSRRALNELADEGLVEKRQGKGTFVSRPKYQRDLRQVISFSEVCRMIGVVPGAQLLERRQVSPNPDVLGKLELPEGSETIFISRLRFMNGEPMSIETNHFSAQRYAFLLSADLDSGSLYEVLREKSGVEIAISRRTIEICRARPSEAKLLSVPQNSPLLLIKGVACTSDGEPVFLGHQLINGERFRFYI